MNHSSVSVVSQIHQVVCWSVEKVPEGILWMPARKKKKLSPNWLTTQSEGTSHFWLSKSFIDSTSGQKMNNFTCRPNQCVFSWCVLNPRCGDNWTRFLCLVLICTWTRSHTRPAEYILLTGAVCSNMWILSTRRQRKDWKQLKRYKLSTKTTYHA